MKAIDRPNYKLTGHIEEPYDIDYDIFGLHKKKTLVTGELRLIQYFRNRYDGVYSDLVVKEERTYTRNGYGLVEYRDQVSTWYLEDGTIGCVKPYQPKHEETFRIITSFDMFLGNYEFITEASQITLDFFNAQLISNISLLMSITGIVEFVHGLVVVLPNKTIIQYDSQLESFIGAVPLRKYYDPQASMEEAEYRRSNLLSDAKLYTASQVGLTNALDLMTSVNSEISLYVQGEQTALLLAIEDSTKEYMTQGIKDTLKVILTLND